MTRDLRLDAVQGRIVLAWHTDEDGLFLRFAAEETDVRLVCRCGRSHWIVREYFPPAPATLAVTCHGCGTRGTFPLDVVRTPRP